MLDIAPTIRHRRLSGWRGIAGECQWLTVTRESVGASNPSRESSRNLLSLVVAREVSGRVVASPLADRLLRNRLQEGVTTRAAVSGSARRPGRVSGGDRGSSVQQTWNSALRCSLRSGARSRESELRSNVTCSSSTEDGETLRGQAR